MKENLQKGLTKARELWNEKKHKEALDVAFISANAGHSESQVFVGWIYLSGGKEIEQDLNEAVKWLEKSSEADNDVGHYLLGIANYRLSNYQKALGEFKIASKMDYYEADYQIGKMYYFGIGVDKDIEKSYEYFLRAKKQGHIFASRQVAVILMAGHKGILNIFRGLLLFLSTIVSGVIIAVKDPDSDKILD